MALAVLITAIYYDQRNGLRIQRKQLRDMIDPFDIPENRFIEIYRLPPLLALEFLEELKPYHNQIDGDGVPLHLLFLSTLNFYASGSYQRRVGLDASACLSQSMVSKAIHKISELIDNNLSEKYIVFPKNFTEMDYIKNNFNEKFNLPNLIGCIDGTHIALSALKKDEEWAYVNRKGIHSVNAQVICDVDCKILNFNARFCGSTHDSYIWSNSKIFLTMERLYNLGYRGYHLLGDSGYPLQPWLLTPVRNPVSLANKNYKKSMS